MASAPAIKIRTTAADPMIIGRAAIQSNVGFPALSVGEMLSLIDGSFALSLADPSLANISWTLSPSAETTTGPESEPLTAEPFATFEAASFDAASFEVASFEAARLEASRVTKPESGVLEVSPMVGPAEFEPITSTVSSVLAGAESANNGDGVGLGVTNLIGAAGGSGELAAGGELVFGAEFTAGGTITTIGATLAVGLGVELGAGLADAVGVGVAVAVGVVVGVTATGRIPTSTAPVVAVAALGPQFPAASWTEFALSVSQTETLSAQPVTVTR
jgi:hypothetical protein